MKQALQLRLSQHLTLTPQLQDQSRTEQTITTAVLLRLLDQYLIVRTQFSINKPRKSTLLSRHVVFKAIRRRNLQLHWLFRRRLFPEGQTAVDSTQQTHATNVRDRHQPPLLGIPNRRQLNLYPTLSRTRVLFPAKSNRLTGPDAQ